MDEPSVVLDSDQLIRDRGTPPLWLCCLETVCLRIFEIRVLLSDEQCNFWTRRQFWRTTCQMIVGSVVTWAFSKHTCRSILRNSIIQLSFNFIPPNQIVNMSLNDLRRRVATHHKNIIDPRMDESSYVFYSGNQITTRGTPPLWFCFLENSLFEDIQN